MFLTENKVSLINENLINEPNILKTIEKCTRLCYDSGHLTTQDSYKKITKSILDHNHLAMLEHCSLSFEITCSRGCSMEIIRHRMASYAQKSTRYINSTKRNFNIINPYWTGLELGEYIYKQAQNMFMNDEINIIKNGGEVTITHSFDELDWNLPRNQFLRMCLMSEKFYFESMTMNNSPQDCKCFLLDSFETTIVMTANLREWIHFINLRYYETTGKVYPETKIVAGMILEILVEKLPLIFKRGE